MDGYIVVDNRIERCFRGRKENNANIEFSRHYIQEETICLVSR